MGVVGSHRCMICANLGRQSLGQKMASAPASTAASAVVTSSVRAIRTTSGSTSAHSGNWRHMDPDLRSTQIPATPLRFRAVLDSSSTSATTGNVTCLRNRRTLMSRVQMPWNPACSSKLGHADRASNSTCGDARSALIRLICVATDMVPADKKKTRSVWHERLFLRVTCMAGGWLPEGAGLATDACFDLCGAEGYSTNLSLIPESSPANLSADSIRAYEHRY
jgi:hypothetical protein